MLLQRLKNAAILQCTGRPELGYRKDVSYHQVAKQVFQWLCKVRRLITLKTEALMLTEVVRACEYLCVSVFYVTVFLCR
jgi:hypothetical protein